MPVLADVKHHIGDMPRVLYNILITLYHHNQLSSRPEALVINTALSSVLYSNVS